MKMPVIKDGEWIRPKRKGYILECCDCGLQHRVNFKLEKYSKDKRQILFQAFRLD